MSNPTLISLTFDDGLRCQFDRAVPILDRHKFPATFFLVANTDATHTDGHPHPEWQKISWNEHDVEFLKDVIRRGHEIGAHSMTHRLPSLDVNARFEVEHSKTWIEERLGVQIESYCYPFYHFTEPIQRAVIDAKYKQARWGANRTYQPEHLPADFFKVDSRQIALDNPGSVIIDGVGHDIGKDGSEQVKGWLQPGWYVLTFHGIGTIEDGWWPISLAEFTREMEELAELQKCGLAEVVTFKEAAERTRDKK